MSGRPGKRSSGRWLPMAHLGVALAILALVIPSALRPPVDNQTGSAELSPDAPPDDTAESIVASLNRGVSGTAGAGQREAGEAALAPGEVVPAEALAPPPVPEPRACPFGWGTPLRQAYSIYSPPCATAWSGDNGGVTSKGVTPDQIRVMVSVPLHDANYNGAIRREPPATGERENAEARTYRVLQEYFNTAYQFYGRRLQLYYYDPGTSEAERRNAVTEGESDTGGLFAGVTGPATIADEFARRKIVSFSWLVPQSFHREREPYVWTWWQDTTKSMRFGAEYLCKKLVGKPPRFNEGMDPSFDYEAPRRIGLLYAIAAEGGSTDGGEYYGENADHLEQFLAEECGAKLDSKVGYDFDRNRDSIATAVTRLRADGITTVVFAGEYQGGAAITNSADAQGYFPEWFLPGMSGLDQASLGRLMSENQWRHAFGFGPFEAAQPFHEKPCFHAYRQIDPENTAHDGVCRWIWPDLLQVANGIQMAGPNLTPETFRDGLFSLGYRWPEPRWAVGGGYAPGDYSYIDDVVELWWDPDATDPDEGQTGTYQYVRGGQRYKLGEFPREDPLVFEDGVTTVSDDPG